MQIFKLFQKKKQNKSLEEILNEIGILKSKTITEEEKNIINEELHKELSVYFFEAVKIRDFNEIVKIINSRFVLASKLIDEKGYNVVEYSLFNDDNELFKFLYFNYFNSIAKYFENIPVLFTIILNKKNFELIELFITEEKLAGGLVRENIAPCLFLGLQFGNKKLIDLVVGNFESLIDARNLEASMIYSISHNQNNELKLLFSYSVLTSKFIDSNIERMLAFSILNQNINALEMMVKEPNFLNFIKNGDPNIRKNILELAYNHKNIAIAISLKNTNLLENENKV